MKFSTIFAGALLAVSANAAAAPIGSDSDGRNFGGVVKVTVTATQTVTKYPKPTTVTVSQTVTKGKTIYTTVYATVTKVKTKTKKVCPASASPTMSIYGRDLTGKKPRAAADQPLYAQEFA